MEKEINAFLKKTQETYDYLMAHNYPEVATQVLRTGSVMAELALKLAGAQNHIVVCGSCKRQLRTGLEIEFYKNVGECYSCDHVRTDYEPRYTN